MDAELRWVDPVPECSIKVYAHGPHPILLPDLSTVLCPGMGPRSKGTVGQDDQEGRDELDDPTGAGGRPAAAD